MESARGIYLAFIGLFIAIGIALAGYFASETILKGQTGANVATVKGLSERLVEANNGNLSVYYTVRRSGPSPDREAMHDEALAIEKELLDIFEANGIARANIKNDPIRFESNVITDSENNYLREEHYMQGKVFAKTEQLDALEAATGEISILGATKYEFSLQGPYYDFTALNDIKPDMLREATENARIAADEFAQNVGVSVGNIQNATQGGFQVSDADNPNSESDSRHKIVRVVTTISFYLSD